MVAGRSERNNAEYGFEHNTKLLPMLTATITEAQDHVIVHDANVRSSWIACMHAKLFGYMYLAVAAHLECRKACGGDVEPTSLIRGEIRHVLAEYRLQHALND
jgi:hypothetical protein